MELSDETKPTHGKLHLIHSPDTHTLQKKKKYRLFQINWKTNPMPKIQRAEKPINILNCKNNQ